MRKTALVVVTLVCALAAAGFAQTMVDADFSGSMPSGWIRASGSWQVSDGKLVQSDSSETISVLNIPCQQSGVMQYEFEVEYVDGFQDEYGGFGIHILVTGPSGGRAWGNGASGLLWLTWDSRAYGPGIFAQIYASTSFIDMGLYPPRPISQGNDFALPGEYVTPAALMATIPIKIVIDIPGNELRLYDPMDMGTYYSFAVDIPISSGSYIGLRTNSLAVRFDNLKVTKLD